MNLFPVRMLFVFHHLQQWTLASAATITAPNGEEVTDRGGIPSRGRYCDWLNRNTHDQLLGPDDAEYHRLVRYCNYFLSEKKRNKCMRGIKMTQKEHACRLRHFSPIHFLNRFMETDEASNDFDSQDDANKGKRTENAYFSDIMAFARYGQKPVPTMSKGSLVFLNMMDFKKPIEEVTRPGSKEDDSDEDSDENVVNSIKVHSRPRDSDENYDSQGKLLYEFNDHILL